MESLIKQLARELSLAETHVEQVVALLDAGNTIPFIARYRKEATGSMEDTTLRALADRLTALRNLQARRADVLKLLEGLGVLTPELEQALHKATALSEVEDIYRPYRPKRRTRATIAREKGLEGLADTLFSQKPGDPAAWAVAYVNEEKGVGTAQEALQGAMDIIAERVSDDAALRKQLRALFLNQGVVMSCASTKEDSVYRLYYDFQEPCAKIPSHRILAILRGQREEKLTAKIQVAEPPVHRCLFVAYTIRDNPAGVLVEKAVLDAWKRLLEPSLEREAWGVLTERAQEQAMHIFSLNLRQLLLQPPVQGKVAMGVDPAYRTGCKIAVVDQTGRLLDTTVVYPTPPQSKLEEAGRVLASLIKKYGVEVIAIGNGTASRETESFVAGVIKAFPSVAYVIVNEAGASVYSASELAVKEFSDLDVTLRSAASIARRLQDPLAELVKIDPKAIGVGQYQHDMPPARLSQHLDGVVEDCVNTVGVDLNTASPALLSRVAGIGPALAQNIVLYREQNGPFATRKEVKKVPKLGPRAFEQAAGFLRIPGGKELLDNTGVHPESYDAARALLQVCGYKKAAGVVLSALPETVRTMGETQLTAQLNIGLPTLRDMVKELARPGRDPREDLPPPLLRSDVLEMKDLSAGMVLQGTVRNIIDFGLFVDIGVHQDGLVHISELADRFVRHPSEVAKVGDVVTVRVLSVDTGKKRIALSMKETNAVSVH